MTWNERKFVNDVLAQNVKDVLAQNVNDVMLDTACAPYGIAMGHRIFIVRALPSALFTLLHNYTGMKVLPGTC